MAGMKKKSRSTNFTKDDEERLISLCKKYAPIIECKKTDKLTWKQKNEAWQNLANDFNAGSTSGPRTAAALNLKFKNLKKDFRKQVAQERQSMYATGGGRADQTQSHPLEHELGEILAMSAKGLENPFDNDIVGHGTTEESEVDEDVEMTGCWELANAEIEFGDDVSEVDKPVVESQDWSSYNPGMLRQKKHPALTQKPALKKGTQAPSTSTSWEPDNDSIEPDQPNDEPKEKTPGSRPSVFKKNQNRPSLKNYRALKPASAVNIKYSALAVSKRKLVDAQLELVEKEIIMKEEIHKKSMLLLDLQAELLKKQLQAL